MDLRCTSRWSAQRRAMCKKWRDESLSLHCSETFSSPTPPSGDSGWNDTTGAWPWHKPQVTVKLEPPDPSEAASDSTSPDPVPAAPDPVPAGGGGKNGVVYPVISRHGYKLLDVAGAGSAAKDHLLKAALLGGGLNAGKSEKYLIAFEKDINSNLQAKCGIDSRQFVSNDAESRWRMSGTNGYNGNRMTGSSAGGNNENLNRLSDGAGSAGPGQPPIIAGAEGMLMGRLGGVAVQEGTRSIVAGTAGAGPQGTVAAAVFRPPQSVSDSGRTFPTAYTTTGAGGAAPFSPLYSSHTGAGIPSYSAFYSQYPGYSATGMHSSLEPPQIGSYSAVLQSMGTHAAQSQVPRSPYGQQYPLLTVSQAQAMGPGGKAYLQNSASISSAQDREELKYRREREQEMDVHRRHSTTGVIQDEKAHHFSVPSSYTEMSRGASLSSAPRESPTHKREPPAATSGNQEFYKVPYSAGSLKHRILRPSEPASQTTNPQHSAFTNTDEPLPKRTKTETLDLSKGPPKHTSHILGEGSPYEGRDRDRGASTSGPHLHYPQHFMKGSIIQLGNKALKRIEDLETDDFVNSADISSDLKIDSCTVVHIEESRAQGTAVLGFVVGEHKVQVTVEATLEHPFFVFGQGWSSCEPQFTFRRYGLECHRLSVGDVCISLTHKEVAAHAAEISQQQQQQRQQQGKQLEGPSSYTKTIKREEPGTPGGSSSTRDSVGGVGRRDSPAAGGHNNTHGRNKSSPGQGGGSGGGQGQGQHTTHNSPAGLAMSVAYSVGQGHQGQGFIINRSETGQSDSSVSVSGGGGGVGGHRQDGRRFETPSSSQIPSSSSTPSSLTSSPSQEQKSHSSAS